MYIMFFGIFLEPFSRQGPLRAPQTSSWKIASNQIAVVPWDVFTLCGVLGHRFETIRGVVQITVPVWTIQRVRAAHPPIAHLYCTCFNFLVIWACSHWAQASNLQQHYWIVWVCFYCLPFFQSLAPCTDLISGHFFAIVYGRFMQRALAGPPSSVHFQSLAHF